MRKTGRLMAFALVPLALAVLPARATTPPNGRILINETFTIGSIRPDGSGWRALAEGDFSHVSWSPDKSKITYVGDEGDHLWVMDADGRNKMKLDDLPRSGGTWSPDGRFLAYAHPGPRETPESPLDPVCGGIWIVDVTTAERRYLGDAFNCFAEDPRWSPDGAAIAFISGEGSDDAEGAYRHVFSMDASTGEHTQLTDSGAMDLHPRWAPDGSRIVFHSTRDHSRRNPCAAEIYVMRADGSRERRLTRSLRSFDCDPTWSDDGRHLAWTRSIRFEGERRSQAWVMRPDGSGKRLVSERHSRNAAAWDFSPDGRWILYTAVPTRQPRALYSDLYKTSIDRSRRVRLTRKGLHSAPRPDW
ncbi:MAG: hypothetical protein ACLGIB_12620 [Actinomycetota bacterium]